MTPEWRRLTPLYAASCPNCGGTAEAERLAQGLPCTRCIPPGKEPSLTGDFYSDVEAIGEALARRGLLQGYSYIYTAVKELREFNEFFKAIVGRSLWSAQRTWAKRLLQHESLAIVAPTGVGKTTLLQIYSLYRASEGARVYYLLPTENLVRQTAARLADMASRAGLRVEIVYYASSDPKTRREEALERIRSGEFQVLVTTTGFLSRRWELLRSHRFDLIVVDDVDAVLRNSRNIDRILVLLGFSEETVAKAYELVKKKMAAVAAKATGRIRLYEQLLEEIHGLEAELTAAIVSEAPGQLVIASATGRARGLKPKVFRELLGFEIGRVYDYTRSIANFYMVAPSGLVEKAAELVAGLGPGGLVFVSKRLGKEAARKLAKLLEEKGLRAGLALAGRKVLERFAHGELDVLVGVASYYGVIVRGIDMPERVLYTVFVGVPSNMVRLEKALSSPYTITRLALSLGYPGAEELVKKVSRLSHGEQTALRIAIMQGESLEGRLGELLEELLKIRRWAVKRLRERLCPGRREVLAGSLYLCNVDTIYVVSPDAATYVQASGRASRMLGSRMTHGVSIVVEEDSDLVKLLEERLKRYIEDARFEPFTWQRAREELHRARSSRAGGGGGKEVKIETSLIVVESPTKAKTIAGFFGRPVRRRIGSITVYETTFYNPVSGVIHVASIAASAGHVYDLSLDGEGIHGVVVDGASVSPLYKPIKRCLSCGHQFSSEASVCPRCGSANVSTKEEIVAALRELASEAERVYIATDPDIEGEKIAYDLYLMLKPYTPSIARIELHEITRNELMKALANPRGIDERMVKAQIVRRIEDRWIGFGLSQRLWEVFSKPWLGAGRVQTPVLGWIIERYREWRDSLGYNVYIETGGARLRIHVDSGEEARRIAEAAENGIDVVDVEEDVVELQPPPPFTTETLLYEASKRLGYTAQKAMRIAQELFEAGLITYHRTDSTHVSSVGISIAREYLERRGLSGEYSPRSWGPQGHHEAIRPTRPLDAETLRRAVATGEIRVTATLRESHYRLYDLIFRRFIASQMRPSRFTRRRLRLRIGSIYYVMEVYTEASGGYALIYPVPRTRPGLAAVGAGDTLTPEKVRISRGSTVQLYSHGDVVMLMKQKGIGRPSTYAKTIENILRHGYAVESKYRRKLVPTKLGISVYDYLVEHYGGLVSEDRTRRLMEEIEMITAGHLDAVRVLKELYAELEELVSKPLTLAPRAAAGEPEAKAGGEAR